MKRLSITLSLLMLFSSVSGAQSIADSGSGNADINPGKNGSGSIYITSSPSGMSVLHDGTVYYGQTPLTVKNLEPGTYIFRIEDHTNFYKSSQISVAVEQGKKTTAAVKLAPNYVTFKISTEEKTGSFLYIDGRLVGKLPYSGKLPFRDFRYRIVPEDPSFRTEEGKITPPEAGITIRRKVSLLEEKGTISVTANPEISGILYVNEIPAGTFPGEFSLYTGEQSLRAEGYYNGKLYSGQTIIRIRKDQFTDVIIKLEAVE